MRFWLKNFPDYSRVHLRRVIGAERVAVDGQHTKAAHRLRAGQQITLTLPELPKAGPIPEDIPLDVLFEDEHLVAVNKPANMVVHPAKGHWSGTLTMPWLIASSNSVQSAGPRAGDRPSPGSRDQRSHCRGEDRYRSLRFGRSI